MRGPDEPLSSAGLMHISSSTLVNQGPLDPRFPTSEPDARMGLTATGVCWLVLQDLGGKILHAESQL